jgi:hypothetical protein
MRRKATVTEAAGSTLGIEYLREYWQRKLDPPPSQVRADDLDFALSGLGVPLRETLQFLHRERPSFEVFEAWIVAQNGGAMDEAELDRLRRALAGATVGSAIGSLDGVEGLSEAELKHWDDHGYVILRGAITPAQAKAAELAVYEYMGASPDDPDSWYRNNQGHSIWVSLYQHPALLANRRSPRITRAFAQLWGREDLWVTIDQAGLNPPERPGWQFPGPHMHWDTTLAPPHYFGLQGILYLADTAEDQGAFTCYPGFHRKLESWLASLPSGVDPRKAILQEPGAKPIAASAGDLVIWHKSLPHASSPNRNVQPRIAQYITMQPTRWPYHSEWL